MMSQHDIQQATQARATSNAALLETHLKIDDSTGGAQAAAQHYVANREFDLKLLQQRDSELFAQYMAKLSDVVFGVLLTLESSATVRAQKASAGSLIDKAVNELLQSHPEIDLSKQTDADKRNEAIRTAMQLAFQGDTWGKQKEACQLPELEDRVRRIPGVHAVSNAEIYQQHDRPLGDTSYASAVHVDNLLAPARDALARQQLSERAVHIGKALEEGYRISRRVDSISALLTQGVQSLQQILIPIGFMNAEKRSGGFKHWAVLAMQVKQGRLTSVHIVDPMNKPLNAGTDREAVRAAAQHLVEALQARDQANEHINVEFEYRGVQRDGYNCGLYSAQLITEMAQGHISQSARLVDDAKTTTDVALRRAARVRLGEVAAASPRPSILASAAAQKKRLWQAQPSKSAKHQRAQHEDRVLEALSLKNIDKLDAVQARAELGKVARLFSGARHSRVASTEHQDVRGLFENKQLLGLSRSAQAEAALNKKYDPEAVRLQRLELLHFFKRVADRPARRQQFSSRVKTKGLAQAAAEQLVNDGALKLKGEVPPPPTNTPAATPTLSI